MRKLSTIVVALFAAGLMAAAAPAGAESSKCAGGQVPGVVKTGTNGANSVAVCQGNGPIKGSITAAYTGGTSGYIVVDGDSTNSDPSGNSDGYIGVDQSGPVCDANGDYPTNKGCP
jgi:hypothetical protein